MVVFILGEGHVYVRVMFSAVNAKLHVSLNSSSTRLRHSVSGVGLLVKSDGWRGSRDLSAQPMNRLPLI